MRVRRHEHVPEAFGLRLGFQILQNRDHLPTRALLVLLLVDRHRRADALVHEGLNPVEPFLLLAGQREIHDNIPVLELRLPVTAGLSLPERTRVCETSADIP
jgi:hypothetical protein